MSQVFSQSHKRIKNCFTPWKPTTPKSVSRTPAKPASQNLRVRLWMWSKSGVFKRDFVDKNVRKHLFGPRSAVCGRMMLKWMLRTAIHQLQIFQDSKTCRFMEVCCSSHFQSCSACPAYGLYGLKFGGFMWISTNTSYDSSYDMNHFHNILF